MDGRHELTADDVLDALAEEFAALQLREGEFTVSQYAQRLGESVGVATCHLQKLMLKGRVVRRPVEDGKTKWAYRMLD